MKEVVGRTCFPIGLAWMRLNPQSMYRARLPSNDTAANRTEPRGSRQLCRPQPIGGRTLLPPDGACPRTSLPPVPARCGLAGRQPALPRRLPAPIVETPAGERRAWLHASAGTTPRAQIDKEKH